GRVNGVGGKDGNMTWTMSYLFKEINGGYVTFGGGENNDRITESSTKGARRSRYVDSGCCRHMTWTMSYLFKEIDGGYVTFGGGANNDRITEEHVTTTSNDPLLSGEDRLKLTELMELCTKLQSRVLALETTKANQVLEIRSLKRRVKKLEKNASLGDQEDASKQGRMINDLDADKGVTLEVSIVDQVPTTGEVVTTVGVETSKLEAKGILMQEPSETPTPIVSTQQPSKPKDKGKAKMIKPKKPLKKKDQIMIDEEVARNVKAQLQAKLEEEERLAK
nr:hypothetical protein [Tanacetum cinerariifolium]